MPRKKATEGATATKAASPKKAVKTRAATTADARPVRTKVAVTRLIMEPAASVEGSQPKKVVKKTAAKKSSTVTRKTTPAYLKMISKAITSIGHRSGSNLVAISHYIEKNYPVKENYKRYLKAAIKRAVDGGEIVKNGAMYRVKTSAKKRTTKRVKKTTEGETAKKPRAKKSTEKSTEKAKASPKKRARKADAESEVVEKVKKPRKNAKSAEQTARTAEDTTSEIVGPKKPVGLKSDYIWQYEEGTWRNYYTEASNVVEDVYQDYLSNRGTTDVRAVRSGDFEYQVDFAAMKQTNITHANHTTRNIRRIKCSA